MKALVLAATFGVLALGARAVQAEPAPDRFVFVAGGDMIGPYHPFPGPEDTGFAVVADLFRGADLGFANQEGSIFDLSGFQGWPAAENGGGYPLQPAAAAREIRAMGIRLVSKANNHATDYGTEGLVETLRTLAGAGIAEGGAGMSESQARAPAFVSTDKGTAALVDVASTFPPMAEAGPAVVRRGQTTRPRPGISVLHVREVKLTSASQIEALRGLVDEEDARPGEARIGDQGFRRSDQPGAVWEMSPTDEAALIEAVRTARPKASFVLFSIHAHETAGDHDPSPPGDFEPMVLHRANEAPSPDDPAPAAFEPRLFHAVIDAGADAVVRTGPHVIGGIEIYAGKPIFYGLGSLFFDFGGRRSYTSPAGEVQRFPEAWFETVIPVSVFRQGRLEEIKLYPMTISSDGPTSSGVPHPADPVRGRRILDRLQALSAAFGTKMTVKDGVGLIRVD